jgi:hypothetical protein
MVLSVSHERANDRAYFGPLRKQMFEDGGSRRLLHHLLNEVEIDWDFISRPIPTDALRDQQIQSLDPDKQWLLDLLEGGALPGDTYGAGITLTDSLYPRYLDFMRQQQAGRRATKEALGRMLVQQYGVRSARCGAEARRSANMSSRH